MKYGRLIAVAGGLLTSLGGFALLRLMESLIEAEIRAHQLDQRFGFRLPGSGPGGRSSGAASADRP